MRKAALLAAAAVGALLISEPLKAAAPARTTPTRPARQSDNNSQILLQADQLIYNDTTKIVSAVGHVEITDRGRTLFADRLDYDQDNDKVTAQGHVVLMDERGNVAFANHVVLTDHMRDGVLSGFGALIGKNGRLAATMARRTAGDIVIAQHAVYSPCKICNQPGQRTPLWQVKSERVIYDQPAHKIHFRDVTLDVGTVPVAWAPGFTIPDPTVRHASGLLMPTVGDSDRFGYFLRLPVYFSFSPSQDLTVEPLVSSYGDYLVENEYRARWDNGGMWLQGSGAYNPVGGLSGSPGAQTYGHIFGSGRLDLGDDWRTGFDLQETTNSAYMQYYDISLLDRLQSDLFAEDTPGLSRLAVVSYYFQGLRSTDIQSRFPYILPALDWSYVPLDKVVGGYFRFNLDGISLARDTGYDDQRMTGEADWKLPFIFGGGQVWTFVLDGRGDAYHFQTPPLNGAQAGDSYVQRGTGYAALDWRWPFAASGGNDVSYVLEPIAQFVAQPYGGNPRDMRIEDSNDYEFSAENVFSFNQIPGYDIIESGPRSNVGFLAETILPAGEIEAQVGQTYRLKPDPLLAAFSGNNGTASNIVASLSAQFAHLNFSDSLDFDRQTGSVVRHEVNILGTLGRSSLEVSYVQLPNQSVALGLPSQEEVNAQADLNVWHNWQIFVAGQRDLLANQFLNTEFGLGYEDECMAIALAYRRRYTENVALGLPPSTAVLLRFSLKAGDTPIEPFSLFPRDVFALTPHA